MRSLRRVLPLLLLAAFAASCVRGGKAPTAVATPIATPTIEEHAVLATPTPAPSAAPIMAGLKESTDGEWTVRRDGSGGRRGALGGAIARAMPEADVVDAPMPSMPAGGAPVALATGVPRARMDARGGPSIVREEGPSVATAPALRAGATDDNAKFADYIAFLDSAFAHGTVHANAARMDVHGRVFVRVLDEKGNAVPAARVTITDEKKDVRAWTATTYGDGSAPFYPRLAKGGKSLRVEARAGDRKATAAWDGTQDLVLHLDGDRPAVDPIKLDVAFVIDTTGSMGDEIAQIKSSLLAVTDHLKTLGKEFDLRYGAVLYRDHGDEYVTMAHPFTSNIAEFSSALQSVQAGGGGDEPESLNEALNVTVDGLAWREGAAKVAFVITDAPPHMDYGDRPYTDSLTAAVAKGIRIHSVAASGLNGDGTVVLRQIAQATRGKFVFIQYGSIETTAASHGVAGPVENNNLDAILYEQIRDEVAHWGKLPSAVELTARR